MSIEEEQAAINRRQRIAEMLMAQGQEPMEQQTAGGYVVPISPLSGVAKVAQQLAGAYVGKKADERQDELYKQRREGADLATQEYLSGDDRKAAAIRAISNELTPKELKAAAANEYTQLNKPEGRQGVPSGFVANEDGSIKPMPVEGYGDYAAFQLAQAGAKAQTPSYGEPERLQMAVEDQSMQRASQARDEQRLRLAEEAAARQEEQKGKPSEFQQWTMQQKDETKARDLRDAISNIDDTAEQFKTLKAIQERTPTGPVIGSAPMVAIRKALPDSIGQGSDLQRLEKGYNELAVKAIGAFKAGGVTFGQLSNAEGQWIKSTQEALNTGTEINKEMLDQGLKLLARRKERLTGNTQQVEQPKVEETKEIGGNTYIKINGEWHEQ